MLTLKNHRRVCLPLDGSRLLFGAWGDGANAPLSLPSGRVGQMQLQWGQQFHSLAFAPSSGIRSEILDINRMLLLGISRLFTARF